MSAVIGALRVSLSIDTAAWESGLKEVQSSLSKVGSRMQSAGQKLSLAVTAPIAGAAAAVAASFHSMTESAAEFERGAQLAGVSATQFQKLAFATKSVGIEADKFSDISKDMRDRIGDFIQTGGGPMVDFFENIAPKVGVTAEQFKNLSGPDALQLFYNSMEKAGLSANEMIFHMEAMASDSSLLLPLLRENGKAMAELGEGAAVLSDTDISALQDWNAAMRQLQAAMQQITIALVSSGLVQWFADTAMAAAQWIQEFAKTNPEMVKWTAVIAGVAAAVGPLLIVFGTLATVMAGISAPVIAAVAAFAALAAGAVALYTNWESISQRFPGIASAVETAVNVIKATFQGLLEVGSVALSGLDALLRSSFSEAFQSAINVAKTWGDTLVNIINTAIPGFREGVSQVIQTVTDMGAQMVAALQGIAQQFLQIGREIIGGLVNGIKEKAGEAVSAVTGIASSIVSRVKGALDIHSPSRVMHEIGNNVVQGLNNGMSEMGADTGTIADSIGSTITGAFSSVIDGSKSVGEALKDVLNQLADMWVNQAFQALFNGKGGGGGGKSGGGGGLGGIVSKAIGGLFGFARGGSFNVGSGNGMHGVDSQLVAFRASPNETVSITRPDQERSYGGQANVSVNVINNAGANVRTETNANGDIDVIVDRIVSQKMAQRGTMTNNALRQGFGARPVLATR